jgi:repressor of nif and glnA expression
MEQNDRVKKALKEQEAQRRSFELDRRILDRVYQTTYREITLFGVVIITCIYLIFK